MKVIRDYFEMKELIILIGLFVIIYSSSASRVYNVDCRFVSSPFRCICKPDEIGKFEVPMIYFNDSRTTELEIRTRRQIPTALQIRNPDSFQRFSRLISLHISLSNMTFDPSYVINAKKWHQIQKDLFDKEGLLDLSVTNAKFNSRRHLWKLPRSLETLNFSHNEYTIFDLRRCEKLLNLDFEGNRLVRMPILNDSANVVRKLNLLNNPLYEFMVENIAPLCNLEELKLNYYSMGSPRRSCECRRLKEWINNLKNWSDGKFTFEGTFKCAEVSDEICKEFTLNEAMRRRNRCLRTYSTYEIKELLARALIVVAVGIGVIFSSVLLFTRHRIYSLLSM